MGQQGHGERSALRVDACPFCSVPDLERSSFLNPGRAGCERVGELWAPRVGEGGGGRGRRSRGPSDRWPREARARVWGLGDILRRPCDTRVTGSEMWVRLTRVQGGPHCRPGGCTFTHCGRHASQSRPRGALPVTWPVCSLVV